MSGTRRSAHPIVIHAFARKSNVVDQHTTVQGAIIRLLNDPPPPLSIRSNLEAQFIASQEAGFDGNHGAYK
jgi:hypothetical protein